MAEEKKTTASEAACSAEEVVVSDVPEAEKTTEVVVEEKVETKEEGEKEKGKEVEAAEEKVEEYKEESNKVEDLVDRQKKALDEFKQLIREALEKHEFSAAAKAKEPKPKEKKVDEEEKKVDEEEKKIEEEEKKVDEEEKKIVEEEKKEEPKAEESKEVGEEPATEAVEKKEEEKPAPPECVKEKPAVETVTEKVEPVEEIKETIVHEVTTPAQPPSEEPAAAKEEEATPPPPPAEPEKVSIWGIPLLSDERTDVILLKFLRARDFKVKEAFTMLKNVVAWRKHFKIEELLEEEGIIEGLENVVYIHGVDKEGHPVCYNSFGEFKDKELYNNTFADAEKRKKFLRWYIQFLEKSIRKLDFSPDGSCTIVQIIDLKNLPGLLLFKLNQATNQALQLLQDNYPEFVAKQVFINVPWWYVAYNRLISPFLTLRTKSKFVFAGPTKTTETLHAYIPPEHVPVKYGGLSDEGDQEFTHGDTSTVQIIKPTSKHIIELPITEASTLVWEVRVVGWDVNYGAEFVPSAEGKYTWVVQKPRKIGPADEQVIKFNFPIGETGKVVLTIDNQSTKKKKLLYRYKTKASNQK